MRMFFDKIWRNFSRDLAIDLGTSNTIIFARGKGVVLDEPSVVAIKKDEKGADRVLRVGREAKMMLGRTPERVEAIRPMNDGVIAHFEIAETMLRHFIGKVQRRRAFMRPRIVIAIPVGITPVEKKAVRECARSAGASEVFLVEEPMAAAIGAGLPITEPCGNMVVDIGGGTTEVAVISLGGIVYSKSVRIAGDKMDEAIEQYVNRNYNFLIGLGTAENLKISIGSAYPDGTVQTIEIRGRDLVSGIPKVLTIDSDEVRGMISEEINAIVLTVRSALEQMPPELSADILDKGIILMGGGSLLKNLDIRLREETRLPVTVTENPQLCVALGAGKVLENLPTLREVMVD